jgi:hypothetical protein
MWITHKISLTHRNVKYRVYTSTKPTLVELSPPEH